MPDFPHHYTSLLFFFLLTVAFCIAVAVEGDLGAFLSFGPNPKALFMHKPLDSWPKVIFMYILAFAVGVGLAYYTFVVERKLDVYVWNPAWYERHKIPLSKPAAYFTVLSQPVVTAIAALITFFLSQTQQLQFILPHLFGSMLVVYPPIISHLRTLKYQ